MTLNHSRKYSRITVAISVALSLTACGSSNESENRSNNESSSQVSYPISVDTPNGKIDIESAPKNIIALDATAAANLISLDIIPTTVMVQGDETSGRAPWMEDEIKDIAMPETYDYTVQNYEKISSLTPDLIVGSGDVGKDDFEQLNSIAPSVITAKAGNEKLDWKEKFEIVAEAFGKEKEAEVVISQIDSSYTAAGSKIEGISQKTYNWALDMSGSMMLGNGEVFSMVGMSPNQDNRKREKITSENYSKLNADFLAIFTSAEGKSKLEEMPMFAELPAVKNGNVLWADNPTADAINSPNPLSLEWLLPTIQSQLENLR